MSNYGQRQTLSGFAKHPCDDDDDDDGDNDDGSTISNSSGSIHVNQQVYGNKAVYRLL